MSEKKKVKEEIIEIKGMHCKSCAEKIEAKLSQLKGVHNVRVNLNEEKAYVRFDPTQTDLVTIKREIESIGYKTDLKTDTWKSSIKRGIIYGLIPHTCCIAFIVASVLGATIATQFLRPLLLNPYLFHILILISFTFATISAIVYIKRQGFISFNRGKDGVEINLYSEGIKRKWKYFLTLYGSTIGVNLLFFMIIFPFLANLYVNIPLAAGAFEEIKSDKNIDSIPSIRLKVDIPCSGHAPLILQELKSIVGVVEARFSFPNIFDVKYDSTRTSVQEILSLDIFKTYKATVFDNSDPKQDNQQYNNQPSSNSGSCCGCSSCGRR